MTFRAFRAFTFHQRDRHRADEGLTLGTSALKLFHVINSVDNTKLPCQTDRHTHNAKQDTNGRTIFNKATHTPEGISQMKPAKMFPLMSLKSPLVPGG